MINLLNDTTGIFHCNQCDYESEMAYKIAKHIKIRHTCKIYQCKDCDHRTKDKHHLKRHMVALHTGLRFNCDKCDFQTAHKNCVKMHSETKHGDKRINSFICDICDFKTFIGRYLRDHKRKAHNVYTKEAYYKMAQLKKEKLHNYKMLIMCQQKHFKELKIYYARKSAFLGWASF